MTVHELVEALLAYPNQNQEIVIKGGKIIAADKKDSEIEKLLNMLP